MRVLCHAVCCSAHHAVHDSKHLHEYEQYEHEHEHEHVHTSHVDAQFCAS